MQLIWIKHFIDLCQLLLNLHSYVFLWVTEGNLCLNCLWKYGNFFTSFLGSGSDPIVVEFLLCIWGSKVKCGLPIIKTVNLPVNLWNYYNYYYLVKIFLERDNPVCRSLGTKLFTLNEIQLRSCPKLVDFTTSVLIMSWLDQSIYVLYMIKLFKKEGGRKLGAAVIV